MRGKDTKEIICQIARFTKVSDSFTFDMNGPDFRNKRRISELEIEIAIRMSHE